MKEAQLGFGIMRLPRTQEGNIDQDKTKAMIDSYMRGGDSCYFDTHPDYMDKKSQDIIRKFVVERYPRDTFMLANKMPYYIAQASDYQKIFSLELSACGVEYFDYYLLHAVTQEIYELHERLGGFSFMTEQKKAGKIKNIGISFHDKADVLDRILQKHKELDFVQLQINFIDWENPVIESRRCYETARKYNKQIIVMEPIKGGSLSNSFYQEITKVSRAELADAALKFVAKLPGINVILSGMSEVEQVAENRRSIRTAAMNGDNSDEKIIELVREAAAREKRIPCTSCFYCVRECPKNIPIPEILSLLNTAACIGENDITFMGRLHMLYESSTHGKGHIGDCVKCGICEKRCPQKLKIRSYLEKADFYFGDCFGTTACEENEDGNIMSQAWEEDAKNVVLWGTGKCFVDNFGIVEKKCRIAYICDNDFSKWGKEIVPGIKCIAPAELQKESNVFVIIMIDNLIPAFEVANQLRNMGIDSFDTFQNWINRRKRGSVCIV